MTAQRIHQPSALPNQPLSATVQQHRGLLLTGTKRMVGRITASQIASAVRRTRDQGRDQILSKHAGCFGRRQRPD
jgi:hypothetical protein